MAPSLTRNALKQTPYDLVYSQIFGKNQVGDAEVESLLNRYGVSAQPLKQADYLRSKAFNVLSASETNQTFGCNYSVQEGEFLEVFQFDTKDGYEHDKAMPKSLAFSCAGETLELRPAGSDFRVLFNGNPTFADWTLIVNDVDYARLASQCRDFWKGTMKLYTLDNWQGSAKGIDAVQQLLAQRNNNADAADQRYYRATSRIETYTTAQQSMEFFYFVMVFIVLLFCGASFIIVLFKTRAESEEERRMLAGLNRIGVTKEEMRSALRFKNMLYFMPQVLVGLPLGMFFIIMVAGFYGYGAAAAAYSLLAGIVLFSLHWLGAMKLGSIKI
jgi:putative ABC transport system permease protein